MYHQIIQHNKFCLNKYLLIENQVQEGETMWKVYKLIKCCNKLKVAPRVKKTEVFRKDWNFANLTYFASCVMRKHYFLLWMKETAFFPYFYHGIIFYNAELFDCAIKFKFYLNIFIFLNINTNQISKEQYLN